MDKSKEYLLGAALTERERLLRQTELFEPEARWLLEQADIQPGGRAIDVGCGALGILNLLSEKVGPTGDVVGLDLAPEMIEMAQHSITEFGLENVQLIQGDASTTYLQRQSFDFVHARLVLVNVSNPEQVLSEMVALARPNAIVALHDVDWISWICEPPYPAWDRLKETATTIWQENGMNVFIGRQLPGLLNNAGLVDVGVRAHTFVMNPDNPRHTMLLSFIATVQERILSQGLMTESELTELVDALNTHLNSPGTITLDATYFQAWGRKPPPPRIMH